MTNGPWPTSLTLQHSAPSTTCSVPAGGRGKEEGASIWVRIIHPKSLAAKENSNLPKGSRGPPTSFSKLLLPQACLGACWESQKPEEVNKPSARMQFLCRSKAKTLLSRLWLPGLARAQHISLKAAALASHPPSPQPGNGKCLADSISCLPASSSFFSDIFHVDSWWSYVPAPDLFRGVGELSRYSQ